MSDPGGDAVLAGLVRDQAGLILARLHRRIGDFDLAEEAVQEAVVAALENWRRDGIPPNPAGWLTVAARRKAIDELRRRSRRQQLIGGLAEEAAADRAAEPDPEVAEIADDRLPMLFGCCHPALAVEARLALTLRSVVGMTTAQIARAFLVPEPTMAQRLVRAKRKITAAGIPFVIPDAARFAPRLDDVLTVISVSYGAGYLDAGGSAISDDAIWLAELSRLARSRRGVGGHRSRTSATICCSPGRSPNTLCRVTCSRSAVLRKARNPLKKGGSSVE